MAANQEDTPEDNRKKGLQEDDVPIESLGAVGGAPIGENIGQMVNHPLPEFTVVYTDGSATPANRDRKASAGIGVFWGKGSSYNISERIGGRQSNNRAELIACCRALQQAKLRKIPYLEIRTDSQFVVQAATKWIHMWLAKGWKSVKGAALTCGTECMALMHFQNSFEGRIAYFWIPGHLNIAGNEEADALARAGAAMDVKGTELFEPLPHNPGVVEITLEPHLLPPPSMEVNGVKPKPGNMAFCLATTASTQGADLRTNSHVSSICTPCGTRRKRSTGVPKEACPDTPSTSSLSSDSELSLPSPPPNMDARTKLLDSVNEEVRERHRAGSFFKSKTDNSDLNDSGFLSPRRKALTK